MEPLTAADPVAVGGFRLKARLGTGGMGQVYLGYSVSGRAVAVKVVHPELARDAEFLRRFRGEVAAAQAVSGVYTAPVIAAGVDDDPPWLATAFVPGPTLEYVIRLRGPLDGLALYRLAAGLAEALGAVHAGGLVHRDLKPTNVLLAEDGPRLIDFGISRALDGTVVTRTGTTIGTPAFMSPEQAEGKPLTPASDVFSLASVLCYAAGGQPPFGDGATPSVLYRVVHQPADLGQVPEPIRDILARCLAKAPGYRPSITELTAALAAADSGREDSAVTFWPSGVLAVIRDYQATLDADPRPEEAQPDHPATAQVGSTGSPDAMPTSTHAGLPTPPREVIPPAAAVRRRSLLAGAGVVALAAAGGATWLLTGSAGPRKPPSPSGTLLWRRQTGVQYASLVMAGNVACLLGQAGIHAFSSAGQPIWSSSHPPVSQETITGTSEGVLLGLNSYPDGYLKAINAANGRILWTSDYHTDGPVTVSGDLIYVPDATVSTAQQSAQNIVALNLHTGSVEHSISSADIDPFVMATGPDGRIFTSAGSGISGLSAQLKPLWTTPGLITYDDGAFIFTIGAAADVVCSINLNRGRNTGELTVIGLDGANGRRQWTASLGTVSRKPNTGYLTAAQSAGAMLLVISETAANSPRLIQAVDTRNGVIAWKRIAAANYSIATSPAGGLYFTDGNAAVYGLDPATGHTLWTHRAESGQFSSIAVGGDILYALTGSGDLYALRT